MARTLAQLRTFLGQLAVLDPYDNMAGESPASSDYNSQLNHAYRLICRRACLWDPKITLTLVADQPTYSFRGADGSTDDFSKRVIDLIAVYINGSPLYMRNQRVPGLWTIQELERDYPSWRTDSSSNPIAAIQENHSTLRLYPAPTATVVSDGDNFAWGTYMPAAMSADGDYPELPEEWHECIAYMAHFIAYRPTATEGEQWNRLREYQADAVQQIEVMGDENRRNLQAWGSVNDLDRDEWLQI